MSKREREREGKREREATKSFSERVNQRVPVANGVRSWLQAISMTS